MRTHVYTYWRNHSIFLGNSDSPMTLSSKVITCACNRESLTFRILPTVRSALRALKFKLRFLRLSFDFYFSFVFRFLDTNKIR